MKAISFLGLNKYQETTYIYQDREATTAYFSEALPVFFPELESVAVLLTPEVQSHQNWITLQARLGDRVLPVPIPSGHSEAELWDIFNALTNVVNEGETVIFDITNSFRSLPFLTFLAAAFLRTARQVRVEAIIYGAFDARDKESNRSPVFNLTPFVSLLDWLTATNQFIYTGDARYLAHLLTKEGMDRRSAALKKAGEQLQSLSLAMMLCRPLEVMDEAGGLEGALQRAETELVQWAQPFGLLAERIQAEYAARALPQPTTPENVMANLYQQLTLIHWYLDNNQVIQAMSLAREWVVTAVGWKLDRGFLLKLGERGAIEWGLGGLLRLGREKETGEIFSVDDLNAEGHMIYSWPEGDSLRKLWGNLTGVRNELDHVGMNPSPVKAAKLARKAQEQIRPLLDELAAQWHIIPHASRITDSAQ